MFASLTSKRKLVMEVGDESESSPLKGVIACLSGMTPAQKNLYHQWIESLGGIFTRDFQTSRNTHLIAQSAFGEKYETAILSHKVFVVTPTWLHACRENKCRVDERQHSWSHSKRKQSLPSSPNKKTKYDEKQLINSLQQALSKGSPVPNSLFSGLQFYLVGFDENALDEERKLFGIIIRRSMGTIFWDFHDEVTHVVVHDSCRDHLRESISKAKVQYFDESVSLVSPWWVITCVEKMRLVDPLDFPAQLQKSRGQYNSSTMDSQKKEDAAIEKYTNLFRGYLFVFLRLSNTPSWMVDYDPKDLEKLVRLNGGQILSLKLLEALKNDQPNTKLQTKRKCHVICWGGNGNTKIQQQFALHPLLSQIQRRNLCEMVLATPNWLQTCVQEQKLIDQSYLPNLFQLQAWPWRRIVVPNGRIEDEKGKENKDAPIRISVTGFTGHRRAALVNAIQAMGATYDDSMRQHLTTHLICAENAVKSRHNQKFQKATEWSIHVVSVDWLYHVLQYGRGGNGDDRGDDVYGESKFSMETKES